MTTFTCPGMVASLRSSSLKLTQTVEVKPPKLPLLSSSSSSVKLEQSDIFLMRSEVKVDWKIISKVRSNKMTILLITAWPFGPG